MNRSDNAVPQGEFEGGDSAAAPDARTERTPGGDAGADATPRADRERSDGGDERGEGERGEGERGERSRRRGRRDRRRGEGGEGAGDGNRPRRALPLPPNFEGPLPLHLQPVAPPEAGEVFAKVLAGEFDTEAEAPVETEEAASKRVLAAEPDAPKLHKVLAQAGIGSRRDMEDLIVEGRIKVNGEPAHTGQRISFGDRIEVDGKPVRVRIVPPPARILAYHKPAGEIVTNDDPEHRPTVFRRLPRLHQGKWQSVGRLDINTEGLLLFTNSGGLANQLMHPRFGVEREYAVRVMGTLGDAERAQLLEGVEVDGQRAAFKSIVNGGGEGLNTWYRVVITEGRNREVRKLFEAVGLTVSRLIRIRYGTVVLPLGLKRGVWVDLDEADVRSIRRLANPQGDGQRNEPRPEGGGPRREERGPRGNNSNSNSTTATTARATIAIASKARAATTRPASRAAAMPRRSRPRGRRATRTSTTISIRAAFPIRCSRPSITASCRAAGSARTAASAPAAARRGRPPGPRAIRSSPIRCRPRSATSAPTRSIARTVAATGAAASAADEAAAEVGGGYGGGGGGGAAATVVVAVAAAGAAADPTSLSPPAPPLQSKALPK